MNDEYDWDLETQHDVSGFGMETFRLVCGSAMPTLNNHQIVPGPCSTVQHAHRLQLSFEGGDFWRSLIC